MSLHKQLDSRRVSLLGTHMHYYSAGEEGDDPILFLHGIPTSAYVWRKVIPALQSAGHCIAPDLIGMGESDKPAIEYTVFEHIRYLEAFIATLGLRNITLVLHGWGSVIGLAYAYKHSENIKAIAFYEAHLQPILSREELSLPMQQVTSLLTRPGASYRAVMQQNYLVERLLPRAAVDKLSDEAMSVYRKPFDTIESRKPLWQYLQELPLGNPDLNQDISHLIRQYSTWLQKSKLPKLMLYAIPGFITTIATVRWAKEHLPALTLSVIDDAMHLAQETRPKQFSQALAQWYHSINQQKACVTQGIAMA